jgi:hypothetical protein
VTTLERRAALLARLDTLERHTVALEQAFVDVALKAEASHLAATLRTARTAIDGRGAIDPALLEEIERTLDAASRTLGSIGRST